MYTRGRFHGGAAFWKIKSRDRRPFQRPALPGKIV